MALFVVAYYAIGMVFILGEPSPSGYNWSFAVFGMFGICAPLILLGLHLAFFGPGRSIRARKLMVAALVCTQTVGLIGMAPWLFEDAARPTAANVIFSSLLSACLFGWPMVVSLMHALMKGD